MSRQCPSCGFLNDDALGFCNKCGEPVDPDVRLAIELKKHLEKGYQSRHSTSVEDDDFEYESIYDTEDEKKPIFSWIIASAAVIAVVLFVIL